MDASAAFNPPSSLHPKQFYSLHLPDSFGPAEAFHVDDLLVLPLDDDVSCPPPGDGCSGSISEQSMKMLVCDAGTLGLSGWNEGTSIPGASGESVIEGQKFEQPSVSEMCMASVTELCVPPDDLADQLEWLSTFVEDNSYSVDTTLEPLVSSDCLSGCKLESLSDSVTTGEAFLSPSPVSVLEQAGGSFSGRAWCLSPFLALPGRARSKRARTGGRVWSVDTLIPFSVNDKYESSDKILTDCSGECHMSSPQRDGDGLSVRPSKKMKNVIVGSKSADVSAPRKCSHCLVQKTPQWRAGPLGPKTLCNACGVRYKSGRLVPEYRPASSPTFVSEVHSNSHKRILEMRKLKEFESSEASKVVERVSEEGREYEAKVPGSWQAAGAKVFPRQIPKTHEDDCFLQEEALEKDNVEDESSTSSGLS